MSHPSYDAIIIGAGHNGLIAAALLAKAGRRVLVLEKQAQIGGAAQTQELFPGFRFNIGAQDVGLLRTDIVNDLGLELTFLESAVNTFAPRADGRGLTLWPNMDKTVASIRQFSQTDAARYPAFVAHMQQMAARLEPHLRAQPTLGDMGQLFVDEPELVRMATVPLREYLDGWFESDALKGVLGGLGITGMMRGPYAQGGVFMLLYQAALLQAGLFQAAQGKEGLGARRFVAGGMGQFTGALGQAARSHGAEIQADAAVASILLHDGAAVGVQLANGAKLTAAAILSCLDTQRTYFGLVGAPNLPPSFVRRVRSLKYRGCTAQIHLALRGLPEFRGATERAHLSGHVVIAPSLEYLERAYDAAKYGNFSPHPYLDIVIPSVLDASMAPAGHHVMSITMQYAPYDVRGKNWDDLAEPLGDAVLHALVPFAPGLDGLVLARRVMTPLDWERQFGLTEGSIYQGEMSMEQMFTMRPMHGMGPMHGGHARASGQDGPIKNLLLCGAAAHPGGGVTGLPGWQAAQAFNSRIKIGP